MPVRSRPRRWSAAALVFAAVLGAPGCGSGEPTGPVRYAVVARGLDWVRVDGGAATDAGGASAGAAAASEAAAGSGGAGPEPSTGLPPLTRHDDFADGVPAGWTAAVSTEVEPAPGGLRVSGVGEAALRGPAEGVVDVSLHHRLLVRARLPADVELRVRWRAAGEAFADERSLARTPGPPDADGFALLSFPLAAMRGGVRAAQAAATPGRAVAFEKGADAAEGVEAFELLLRPAPDDAGTADRAQGGATGGRDAADGDGVDGDRDADAADGGDDGSAPAPRVVEAVLASVTLASDYDRPDPQATLRVDRRGVLRTARAFRIDDAPVVPRTPAGTPPGAPAGPPPRTRPADRPHDAARTRFEAPLDPGPRDRLRLAFAVAGARSEVAVTVSDTSGRLPHRRLEFATSEVWREVALDLSPLEGEPTRLVLEVHRAGGDEAAAAPGGVPFGEAGTADGDAAAARAPGGDPAGLPGAAPSAGAPPSADPSAPRHPAVLLVAEALRLAPASTPRPDVVLYLVDTLRADRLGVYGHERPTDPHLAAVARAGVVVERLTAASNWTRPATTSLLTSLDPLRHGNLTHRDRIADGVTTLAEALAGAGYVTTSFVTNYNAGAWSGLDQGFDVAREPTAYGASRVATTLTSAVLAEPVAAFLAEHADEQVFVYVHSMDPHQPYRPPMDDLYPIMRHSDEGGRPSDALDYEGEIRHNDRMLARLDEALAAEGLLDDTLLVVTSDHGEAFGEHGVFAHRSSLHEEQLRVPWVLRWPAGLPAGRRVDGPITHVDVAPTLLGLAGVPAPDGWRGLDLSTFLRGDGPGDPEPDRERPADGDGPSVGAPARAVRTGPGAPDPDRPLLVHTTHGTAGDEDAHEELAVLRGGWKLVAGVVDGDVVPRHLYLLTDDPGETEDLVDDPAHAAVRTALARWGADALREGRTASTGEAAEAMDPERRRWMEEMGYLR